MIGMPKTLDASQARAEALFRRREQQKADAPIAMAEYRAAQKAALDRMHELRRLRLARDAEVARKDPRGGASRGEAPARPRP